MYCKILFVLIYVFSSITAVKAQLGSDSTIYNQNAKSTITLLFDNIVGDKNLQLNTGVYSNGLGEEFSVSLLQYFISNITLTTATGIKYVVPQNESYFLVKEQDAASQKISLQVPEGVYTNLSFVVGVDSVRSTLPISERPGVLDPANYTAGHEGMYWSWNSGYIFYKLEGSAPIAKVDPAGNHFFRYHIGLFGGINSPTINNIKVINLDLNAIGTAKVKAGAKPIVHIIHDLLKTFNGATLLSIASKSTVMVSPFSAVIADNYATSFRHDHTHNN